MYNHLIQQGPPELDGPHVQKFAMVQYQCLTTEMFCERSPISIWISSRDKYYNGRRLGLMIDTALVSNLLAAP